MGGRLSRMAVALASAALVCGCAVSPGSKAGPEALPITVHLATAETDVAPYAEDVRAFASDVEELSGGAVRVAVDWERIPWAPDSEIDLARMVGDGSLDLALLPTRAIAEAGAERLDVLQAPFLIDSAALASAVARSPIAAELLEGLDPEAIVGLSMLPEGIRRPVGYADALISPSDYAGRGIRVPVSEVAYEMFTALGAVPSISTLYQEGADGEELSAAESGPEWRDSLPAKTVTTADVGFYPKFDMIVGSERLWSELSDTQRATLREAADRTSARASARRSTDAGEFAAYCSEGGMVALAGSEARDALSRAADPVMVRLAADPDRAELLKSLRALKEETAVPPFEAPPECRPLVETGGQSEP